MTMTPVNSAADLLAGLGAGASTGAQPGAGKDGSEGFFALVMKALHGGEPGASGTPGPAAAACPGTDPKATGTDAKAGPVKAGPVQAGPSGPTKDTTKNTTTAATTDSAIDVPADPVPTVPNALAPDTALVAGLLGAVAPVPVSHAGQGSPDPKAKETAPAPSAKVTATGPAPSPAPTAVTSRSTDGAAAVLPGNEKQATPAPAHDLNGWTGLAQPTKIARPKTDQPLAAVTATTGTPSPTTAAALTPASPILAQTSSTATSIAPDPVTTQLADRITSLVSRGDGTHRITMTLNPEQLGEVKVVMTIRDGAVHVRLAAGHEARAALVDGSPELNRLLAQAGATTSHVTVRELPQVTPSTSPASTNPDLGAGGAQPESRQPDQHAGTRADQPATDGNDTTPRRLPAAVPAAARLVEIVAPDRATGLDVTM